MKLDVPSEFVEVLKGIERDVPPGNVVDWLRWASDNPQKARSVAEAYGKLGRCGRHEFEVCLWCGDSPEHAIQSAVEDNARHQERRRLLSKVIANAKRGGYNFKLENGVECTVVRPKGKETYWFRFKVAGEEIDLVYTRRGLMFALESLKGGEVSEYKLEVISYRGKLYSPWTKPGETILNAIKKNINPRVLATVDP